MGRRKKGVITCKHPGCTEPRHVWPGGSRATYCLEHFRLTEREKRHKKAGTQPRPAPVKIAPKNACSLCHRDLRQAALAALTHHVWCQCCTPPKTPKNRLFARLSEAPSESSVEIAIIDYPADKIRYATTRAIESQPMPETRRDLLELRKELEARGALVAVHELEGSLSN